MKIWHELFRKKTISVFILLLLFWLILSPSINGQSLLVGLLVSLGVVLYNQEMLFSEEETSFLSIKGLLGLLRFIYVLIVEILKANLQVAQIVLSPTMKISPCYVRVPVSPRKLVNQVLYANSITLTPGTLSVDMDQEGILVHALTTEAAEGMEGNALEKYILLIEGDARHE